MNGLRLYLRSRRIPFALGVATATTALIWALALAFAESATIDARAMSLTVMLAVVALGTTLSGADDSLEATGAINWPARRAGHLLLAGAAITALLSLSTVTEARFEPLSMVLRNTVGLLGLAALGAALFGAGLAWVAPLSWTLVAALPFTQPSAQLGMQITGWLIQPTGTTVATVCASVLAVTGMLAYVVLGCPVRTLTETPTDH